MNAEQDNGGSSGRSASAGSFTTAALLWTLIALFALRVLGQAVQRWWPHSFLPPFDAFQGSGLGYPLLLSAQLIILALLVRAALRVGAGRFGPGPRQRRILTGFGALYMAGSVLRIAIGLALPAAPHWFTAWIPAFFHLVLATFVIILALRARTCVPDSAPKPGAGA